MKDEDEDEHHDMTTAKKKTEKNDDDDDDGGDSDSDSDDGGDLTNDIPRRKSWNGLELSSQISQFRKTTTRSSSSKQIRRTSWTKLSSSSTRKCSYCGSRNPTKRCACKEAFYCSLEHQRLHWKEHKKECSCRLVRVSTGDTEDSPAITSRKTIEALGAITTTIPSSKSAADHPPTFVMNRGSPNHFNKLKRHSHNGVSSNINNLNNNNDGGQPLSGGGAGGSEGRYGSANNAIMAQQYVYFERYGFGQTPDKDDSRQQSEYQITKAMTYVVGCGGEYTPTQVQWLRGFLASKGYERDLIMGVGGMLREASRMDFDELRVEMGEIFEVDGMLKKSGMAIVYDTMIVAAIRGPKGPSKSQQEAISILGEEIGLTPKQILELKQLVQDEMSIKKRRVQLFFPNGHPWLDPLYHSNSIENENNNNNNTNDDNATKTKTEGEDANVE